MISLLGLWLTWTKHDRFAGVYQNYVRDKGILLHNPFLPKNKHKQMMKMTCNLGLRHFEVFFAHLVMIIFCLMVFSLPFFPCHENILAQSCAGFFLERFCVSCERECDPGSIRITENGHCGEQPRSCSTGPIFIKHLRWKTKKSEISWSSNCVCFFDYLKTICVDLYRIGSATYHNNINELCSLDLL